MNDLEIVKSETLMTADRGIMFCEVKCVLLFTFTIFLKLLKQSKLFSIYTHFFGTETSQK